MHIQNLHKAARDFVRQNGRWIGGAVSLLALAAFAYAFSNLLSLHDAGAMVQARWPSLLLALALYGGTYVPMCLAWKVLARGSGARIGLVSLLQVYLVSQIGKYLPGNVGHLVGRAYLARTRGVPLETTGLAMSLELIGVLAAGALFAGIAGLLSPVAGQYATVPVAAAALALAMLATAISLWRRRIPDLGRLVRPMLAAFALYLLVFALFSAANIALLGASSWALVLRAAGAIVLSWLVGFMVPGAPAGLGLRELSLYTLLSGAFPEDAVLFAVAGMRLVTMTGDAIAWLTGLALGRIDRHPTLAVG